MKQVLEFLKRLFAKNLVIAFLIVDTLGFIFLGKQLPYVVYPISLAIGLIIGSYLVFEDIRQEKEAIEARLRSYEESLPKISVGFNLHGELVEYIELEVHSLTNEPDYESEVEKKRRELIAKYNSQSVSNLTAGSAIINAVLGTDKATYEVAVESFLLRYRKYIEDRYLYDLYADRLREFWIVLENNGGSPAEKITIEILVTDLELFPSEDQLIWHLASMRDEPPSPPKEPELSISRAQAALESISSLSVFSPWDVPDPDIDESNTKGPTYNNDRQTISYFAREVIHNIYESDFNSFILWLGEITDSEILRLQVHLYAGNVPEPLEIELLISVSHIK